MHNEPFERKQPDFNWVELEVSEKGIFSVQWCVYEEYEIAFVPAH